MLNAIQNEFFSLNKWFNLLGVHFYVYGSFTLIIGIFVHWLVKRQVHLLQIHQMFNIHINPTGNYDTYKTLPRYDLWKMARKTLHR